MKQIVSIFLVIGLIVCVFTACSTSEVIDKDYTGTSENQQTEQGKKEPLWIRTLQFGSEDTVEFSELVYDNGKHMISVVCDFDGKEPAKEYGRITTIISMLQYFQKADFMIVIDSGDEKGLVSYTNGELDDLFTYYPSTYTNADTSETANEAKVLMDNLKDVLG